MCSALNQQEWTDRLKPKSSSELSKVRQLYLALYDAIATGDLHHDLVLPTSRALSRQLSLGRNTVLAAYTQLESEGLIHSEGRRGTRVTYKGNKQSNIASIEADTVALSTRASKAKIATSDFNDLAPGMPDPSLFPAETWRKAMRKAAGLTSTDLGYALHPLPALQQAVARYLRIYRSLSVDPAQILITSGTRQSLVVAATLYADPGDHAWVESPGYPGAVDAFKTSGLKLHAMPVHSDGAALIKNKSLNSPALIYLTPCFHYPTGNALAMHRRQEFLDYASTHGVAIFEDDYDSEFRDNSEARPALASQVTRMPTDEDKSSKHPKGKPAATVLHAGTFSKLIFPAARVAWLVLPAKHMDRAQTCLKSLGGGHNRVAQAVIAELLENGSVARHLQSARRIYAQRRIALIKALNDSEWFLPIEETGGSLSLVAKLTHTVPADTFNQLCREHQLGVQPFEKFHWNSPETKQVSALVLGVGNINTLAIPDAIARLHTVLNCSVKNN